jgi:RND family efflux transporter MFP subunit
LLAAGAAAYAFWPAAGIPVHAVTAEALPGGSGGGLDATGYVVARRQATLSAKILGKLVEVNVEEGERVAQGRVVARLDDSNYLAALKQSQAQAVVAKVALDQAKTAYDDTVPNYRRYRVLAAQGAISAEALDSQKTLYDAAATARDVAASNLDAAKAAVSVAQANEDDTVVRAPFAGVVTDKAAQPGEIVAPAAAGGGFTRTGIATVVDMDSLEVQVDVSENYIDRVRSGQTTAIRLDAYPDWEIPASVIAIIPTADESKGTVKVRIAIHAKDARILPQMGARVSFMAALSGPIRSVLVPMAAIKRGSVGASVFVIEDENRVAERPVRLGVVRGTLVTITSGLSPGERIAIGDFGRLRDSSRIRIGGGG